MLGESKGTQKFEYFKDYVVFDLETTGVSCKTDKVVEISAVKVIGGKVTDEFTTLVNPECPIPFYASQVNGITDEMVADAPLFRDALSNFLEFIGDFVLVGHNIHSFDLNFIYRDCNEYFGQVPVNDYVDTLKLSRVCFPELPHHTLSDLADHFGIESDGAHRALFDCKMNQAVYERIGEILPEKLKTVQKCPKCGNFLQKRNGKFGEFWGCMGYPNCRYTKNI